MISTFTLQYIRFYSLIGCDLETPCLFVTTVHFQTPQGTVLIPLQTFMAFNQLKQQQQLAASIAGGVANSPDATPTAATTTNQQQQQQQRSGMSRGGEKEVHQLDGTLPDLSFVSRTRRGQKEEEDKSNLETVFLSSSSTATSVPRDTLKYMDCSEPQGLLSSSKLTPCTQSVVLSQPNCSNSLSLQQKFEPVPPSDDKLNCHGDHFSNARFEVHPDGPISDKGQSSKVIVQLDGASGGLDNGSSSDDDSDAEDDSSEVSLSVCVCVSNSQCIIHVCASVIVIFILLNPNHIIITFCTECITFTLVVLEPTST